MSQETEASSTPAETSEVLALPETTVTDTIGSAFSGTVQDAEKARETASPWGAPVEAPPIAAPEQAATPTDDFGDDEPDEEPQPKAARRKMTPEEREARAQKKHEQRMREAEAYLRVADRFYLSRVASQLGPLLNGEQLNAVLTEQTMSTKERDELKEPLAEVLEEEGMETSPTTRLMMIAFAIYAPKLDQVKRIKEKLAPEPTETNG